MNRLQPPPSEWLDKVHGEQIEDIYTARVVVSGGEAGHGRASGHVRSEDGALHLNLRLPAQLDGPGGGANPEQLLAAAYAACFHGALALTASRRGLRICGASVAASVTFARDPVDGMFLLTADVTVGLPDIAPEVAEELIRSTERSCPYAKMFREGIPNTVRLARKNDWPA